MRNRRALILRGDKALAGRYVPFGNAQLDALFRGGVQNRVRTFTPASDVTVRVERVGDHGRVWIEAGGADVVASAHVEGADSVLFMGRLRGGTARERGASLFGQVAGHNLYPLGDGAFIGGPGPHELSGAAQLVSARNKRAEGAAFSPWQDGAYSINGVRGVLYSGLVDAGEGVTEKRLHVGYDYNREFTYLGDPLHGNGPQQSTVTMPAISTSLDSGVSFSTTVFNIPIQAFNGSDVVDQADIRFEELLFLGQNRIVLVCTTLPSRLDNFSGADRSLLYSILTLTSADGGVSWAVNATQVDSADSSRLSAVYVGGSTILALSNHLSADIGQPLTVWRSTDAGVTFTKLGTNAGVPSARFTDVVALGTDAAGFQRNGFLWRTLDAGASWTGIELPADFTQIRPGRIAVHRRVAVPDPLPPGKVAADYVPLAMIKADDVNSRVVWSEDGGATWKDGGAIPENVPNIGVVDKKLPPFPVFPDLHKNGLDV